MQELDELSEIIGLVYEAAIEPQQWHVALSRTVDFVGAEAGLLGIGSCRVPSAGLMVPLTLNVDPFYQQRWVESYLEYDVWWLEFSKRFAEGVLTASDCVPAPELRRTQIYNDLLAHAGIEDGLFAGIARTSGGDAIAAFYRGKGREPFGLKEAERLRRLLPHLQRAIRVDRLLANLEAERDAGRAGADRLSVGMVHLDGRGRVVHMNRLAEKVIASGDDLGVRNRELRPRTRRGAAALQQAIATAVTDRSGALLHLDAEDGSVKLVLYVLSIPRGAERPFLLDRGDRAEILVLLTSTDALEAWPVCEASRVLGLTLAEAELALALARGQDLAGYAEGRGIQVSTARWRMKRVLEKTRSQRQSDVVRLVLTTLGRLAEPACGDALERPRRDPPSLS